MKTTSKLMSFGLSVVAVALVLSGSGCAKIRAMVAPQPGLETPSSPAPTDATAIGGVPASAPNGGSAPAEGAFNRSVVVLVHRGPQNPFRQQCSTAISERVLPQCGPGDRFILIYERPQFKDWDNVKVRHEFVADEDAFHRAPATVDEFNEARDLLNGAWDQTDADVEEIRDFLAEAVTKEEDGYKSVDFAGAFRYAAEQLSPGNCAARERYLYILGPVPTDPKVISALGGISLKGVQVKALYQPRSGAAAWTALQTQWQKLMTGAGADGFSMLDKSESQLAKLLPPSGVPEAPPPPGGVGCTPTQ